MNKQTVELLMPAGDLERLKVACLYGADAVYIGGKRFSLRAKASNFTMEDIIEGVRFAHERGKKVYVTVNIVPHWDDLGGIDDYLKQLDAASVDAAIVSSFYIMKRIAELNLRMECHVSTQVSALNSAYLEFFQRRGCTRVVLARECSLEDIARMRALSPLELEVFVQGGLCSSCSGKCTLSNYFVNRDANRGGCAHTCRWEFELYRGEERVSQHPFRLASKDLMGIRRIGDLICAGVSSLKVEGRMKSLQYIAVVASTYRSIIDAYAQGTLDDAVIERAAAALKRIESRPLCEGFLSPEAPMKELQIYSEEPSPVNQSYLGYVRAYDPATGRAEIVRKNTFFQGETIEIFGYDCPPFDCRIRTLEDSEGAIDAAEHTQKPVYITVGRKLKPYMILRRKERA